MAEAILISVSKIEAAVLNEEVSAIIEKLSRKVAYLKELPASIERIGIELKVMTDVIQDFGTTDLSSDSFKDWISIVKQLAYHAEDVADKYSYEALKIKEEGLHGYVFGGSRQIKVFSKIADEVVEIEKKIRYVSELVCHWINTVLPIINEHADIDRNVSNGFFPELVSDEDIVGIDENRSKLTEWLTTDEEESTVISVSGMGGLGKTALVKIVYDREHYNRDNLCRRPKPVLTVFYRGRRHRCLRGLPTKLAVDTYIPVGTANLCRR